MTPPRPSVATERKVLRGYAAGSSSAAGAAAVATRGARDSASTAGAGVRTGFVTSRIQRKPKTIAITAPTTATTVLTISPVRTQAMPTANPIGQRLGGGRCGWSWSLKSLDSIPAQRALSTTYQLPQPAANRTDSAILT